MFAIGEWCALYRIWTVMFLIWTFARAAILTIARLSCVVATVASWTNKVVQHIVIPSFLALLRLE